MPLRNLAHAAAHHIGSAPTTQTRDKAAGLISPTSKMAIHLQLLKACTIRASEKLAAMLIRPFFLRMTPLDVGTKQLGIKAFISVVCCNRHHTQSLLRPPHSLLASGRGVSDIEHVGKLEPKIQTVDLKGIQTIDTLSR